MPQRTSPFIESKYGWEYGENGWNSGMDENILKFSFMFDRNIDGIVSTLPPAVNGQAYFLTTDKRLYFAVGTNWYSTAIPLWFELVIATTGDVVRFNGDTLITTGTTSDVVPRLEALEVTVTSLQSSVNSLQARVDSGVVNEALTAQKWKTPRTLTLTGGATGSVILDGSSNVSMDVTVSGGGTGTGDATTLDGQPSSFYRNASNINAGTLSSNFLPSSITSSTTGNAATATKLQSARTISLTGDATGSVSFDGSSNVSMAVTVSGSGGTGNSPLYNVKDYGAVGDGTTNDRAAIQACIDAAPAGATIFFPATASSYRVTGTITVNKTLKITGGKTKIKSVSGNLFDLQAEAILLEGLILEGSRAAAPHTAIRMGNNFITVKDCTITLFHRGFEVWGGVWHNITNIRMRNISTTVIEIGNIVGTTVTDLRYDTDVGTYAQPTRGILLYGEGCNFADLDLIHAGRCVEVVGGAAHNPTWNFFNSCSFDTSLYGLYVAGTDTNYYVKGLMFQQCWFSSHSEAGIYASPSQSVNGITLNGCHVVNNGKYGVYLGGVVQNVDINGCVFAGNSIATAGGFANIYSNTYGRKNIRNNFFGSWGALVSTVAGDISRGSIDAECVISNNVSLGDGAGAGYLNQSSTTAQLGTNFGSLPSGSGGSGTVASADKLTTARTITLAGKVSGSASFDGSQNITITTTETQKAFVSFGVNASFSGGNATVSHSLGRTPVAVVACAFGGATINISPTNWTSTTVTLNAVDIVSHAAVTGSVNVQLFVA